MQGIIKQPPAAPALPDLRNLGTILRILLAVNGATLLIALAREPRWPALATEGAPQTGSVETQICARLAGRRGLARAGLSLLAVASLAC